jgi:hypothetical protein
MNRLIVALVAATFLLGMRTAEAVETPNLDGVWEGTLHFTESSFSFDQIPDAKSTHEAKLRVEIHGPVVAVFYGNSDKTDGGTPGIFHIAQVKTNAIIFGTNYEQGDGPGWTESIALIVTPKDDKTLLVSFSRLVNNSGFDGQGNNVKFGIHLDGELARVDP